LENQADQPNPDLSGRPAEQEGDLPLDEAQLTFGQWLKVNGFTLTIVTALFVYLFMKFDSDGLWAIAKAALGLSFVIFIHELGHFLVAKWCDVHVTTFSIGFGPAIPGCSFQWGETTYKLALFPLGGYVQMVGQVDGDESSDSNEDDPRSYRNKSVGQRMAIISAGVVMNVILAFICFIIVFRGPGKERQAAVISGVDPGSPSFKKGLRAGAEILQIEDVKAPYFDRDLMVMVMTSRKPLDLVYQRPEDPEPTRVTIQPQQNEMAGRQLIGIAPSKQLKLVPKRLSPLGYDGPVKPGSAAARATPAFQFEDEIIGTTDPADPRNVTELPFDPRKAGKQQRDYFEFHRRMQLLAGQPVTLRVRRLQDGNETTVDIQIGPAFHHILGVRMQMGRITAIREGSPGDKAGIRGPERIEGKTFHGDVILRVELPEPDGKLTVYDDKNLDPVRLPDQLRQWADRYRKTKPNADRDLKVRLTVQRHSRSPNEQMYEKPDPTVELLWDDSWRFDTIRPSWGSPLAIPELGIAYQVKPIVAGYDPVRPGNQGLLSPGDSIRAVRFSYLTDFRGGTEAGERIPLVNEKEGIELDNWAFVFELLQSPQALNNVTLEVKGAKEDKVREINVWAFPDPTWPLEERGLFLNQDLRIQRADTIVEAVALGLGDTHHSVMQVYQNLRAMISGDISIPKNLGGPVTIARVAYKFAGFDFWEFIFFLGLISVNLAVINFLPIPVLDGGHMVFLLYEKVRGKPASEGVRVGATYAGLALILCLMVFVLYLDISRLF
jgi:regulator of sigma E protease